MELPALSVGSDGNTNLEGADALAIMPERPEFGSPDFDHFKATRKHPVIFDGRNLYNPDLMMRLGFSYPGVGRGLV
jgi:UDPglucose 6-dehydrogenase